MQFITLNQRHHLGRLGFKYAFVFKTYSQKRPSEYAISEMVRKAEGMGYDNTFHGKSPGNCDRRPYYVGFNNETTATLVQLQL